VGSVLLAGVLLKMGTYGMLRFAIPFFPSVAVRQASLWMALGVAGILYGAWMSWVQKDMKRLIAYSSVAHMGFILLGMFSFTVYGLSGGMLQMLNHGISTGALFFSVGMLYERRHSRLMEAFGGVAREMPVFATLLGIVAMSSLGLPGLNGFVGEFLSLLGAFQRSPVLGVLGVVGVIFAAVYLLHMLRQVLFLTSHTPRDPLVDLRPYEFFVFLPLLVMIFWIGVYPRPFLRILHAPVEEIRQVIRPHLSTSLPIRVQEPQHTPEVHP
jgi:NADH-quinone oxidoreductase subunit M